MYDKLPLKSIAITDNFGLRMHPISKVSTYHYGLDLGWVNYKGEPVIAAHDSKVVAEGYDQSLGNYIVLKYTNNKKTIIMRYLHLKNRALVKKGTEVKQNKIIGYMGETGYAEGVHLHFEYWICPNNYMYKSSDASKYAQNPLKYCYLFEDQKISNSSKLKVKKVIGTPTSKNNKKSQIKINKKGLRCREKPSIKGKILGYINLGYFNILDTKKYDNYTWYKIGENKWIAGLKSMTTKYLVETTK